MSKCFRIGFVILLSGVFSAAALAQSEIISTVAGNGDQGYTGSNGIAVGMDLFSPRGVSVDALGNFYFADMQNHRVCKVAANGSLTTVAGRGAISGSGGDGGLATNATLTSPNSTAIDSLGNLYIAEKNMHRIRKVNAAGIITAFAGTSVAGFSGDGSAATAAKLNRPQAIAVDRAGNLYIADAENHRIRMVNTRGIISTVAGSGHGGYSGDGGDALDADLNSPQGIAVDESGDIYFADYYNHRIRRVDAHGIITTVAGTGSYGFSGDGGDATEAELNGPQGIAIDVLGNLFITDGLNNRIRKVNTDGIISTIVGTDDLDFRGDGGPVSGARVYYPADPAIDAMGNLYFSDTGNYRIRKITRLGGIATYFPQIAVGGGYTTRFTITNAGASLATGFLRFSNSNGEPLEVSGELTDAAGALEFEEATLIPVSVTSGGVVFITIEASENNASVQTGYARLTAIGGALSSVVSYEWVNNEVFTSMVGVIESIPYQYVTIPVDNDTSQGKQLAYALVNPTGMTINIKLALVGLDGTVVDDTKTIRLSPGQYKVGYLEQIVTSSNFKGTLVLRGQSTAVFAMMALVDKQNVLTSVPIAAGKSPLVPN